MAYSRSTQRIVDKYTRGEELTPSEQIVLAAEAPDLVAASALPDIHHSPPIVWPDDHGISDERFETEWPSGGRPNGQRD